MKTKDGFEVQIDDIVFNETGDPFTVFPMPTNFKTGPNSQLINVKTGDYNQIDFSGYYYKDQANALSVRIQRLDEELAGLRKQMETLNLDKERLRKKKNKLLAER